MAQYLGQKDDLKAAFTKTTTDDLQRSEKAHLAYQALSRGSCRMIDNGQARPMKGYLVEIDPQIETSLTQVMPGVKWHKWTPFPSETINVDKLTDVNRPDRVDGVTIIWTARHPTVGGSYVIGWYRDATVFRDWQLSPKDSKRTVPGKKQQCGFYIIAKARDTRWLDRDERSLQVPRGKGGMGQANVWFADSPRGRRFLQEFSKLVKGRHSLLTHTSSSHASGRKGWKVDAKKRVKVEEAAMQAAEAWYEVHGYCVSIVAHLNRGWDLEASSRNSPRKNILRIEVKCISASEVSVELTPNEFKKMTEHLDSYRLCVVTNPESVQNKKIYRFGYSEDSGKWVDQWGIL